MIFDCPKCGASNPVPSSSVPIDGHVVSCHDCGQRFRVVKDAHAGSGDTREEMPQPVLSEHTSVDRRPSDEDYSTGAIPSDADFGESDATLGDTDALHLHESTAREIEPKTGSIEPHTVPIDTSNVKLPVESVDAATIAFGRAPSQIDELSNERIHEAGEDEAGEGEAETVLRASVPARATSSQSSSPSSAVRARGPQIVRASRSQSQPGVTVTPAAPSSDVYGRIARGDEGQRTPAPTGRVARPGTKAWDEPSMEVRVPPALSGRGPAVEGLRKAARALERAPFPIKVWLVVFPLALGLILMLTPSRRDKGEPIALPIAPQAPTNAGGIEVIAADGDDAPALVEPPPLDPEPPVLDAEPANEVVEPVAAPQPPVPAEPEAAATPIEPTVLDDPSAPDGMAFVQSDRTVLRVVPGARGRAADTLNAGTLVKRYDMIEDRWILVRVMSSGAVGYVAKDVLDERKPLAALAREIDFGRCRAGQGGTERCMDDADRRYERCTKGCFGDLRCEKACQLALQSCAKLCRTGR